MKKMCTEQRSTLIWEVWDDVPDELLFELILKDYVKTRQIKNEFPDRKA